MESGYCQRLKVGRIPSSKGYLNYGEPSSSFVDKILQEIARSKWITIGPKKKVDREVELEETWKVG